MEESLGIPHTALLVSTLELPSILLSPGVLKLNAHNEKETLRPL